VLPPASVAGETSGALNFSAAATWACWFKSSIWKYEEVISHLDCKQQTPCFGVQSCTWQEGSSQLLWHFRYLTNICYNALRWNTYGNKSKDKEYL